MGNKVNCCSATNHEDDERDQKIMKPNLFDEEEYSDYEDE